MVERRSQFDVTNQVDITDSGQVLDAVAEIHGIHYPGAVPEGINQAFEDVTAMYQGDHPAFYKCDTAYHDLQHVMDVTLAMARLMDGYERRHFRTSPLGDRLFQLGIVIALFHDCGYIRNKRDTRHQYGAEYTLHHVSRGAALLERYLPTIGFADLVPAAVPVIHFTGYEIPVDRIKVPAPIFRRLGNLLGSADIISQMADRCYLEKCRDRLYPEFVLGGIARRQGPDGEEVVFSSAADLVNKTPGFYRTANRRLQVTLEGACEYAAEHFDGSNLYLQEVERNIGYAERVAETGDLSLLRRRPPESQAVRLI
ncbi:MAG: hypothetical protein HYU77_16845 [Betaproteobacteria bacterium]|nr:hypothetical protein [Betaproteobacteria bacterium]